jgi:hypothetical protein
MSGNLGSRFALGQLSTANKFTPGTSLWVVTFKPETMPSEPEFEIWHGAVRGPGGIFLVYIDDQLFGVGENGLINEYAPSTPMFIRKGQAVTLHWSIATAPAPTAWFYFRRPEVGRI